MNIDGIIIEPLVVEVSLDDLATIVRAVPNRGTHPGPCESLRRCSLCDKWDRLQTARRNLSAIILESR